MLSEVWRYARILMSVWRCVHVRLLASVRVFTLVVVAGMVSVLFVVGVVHQKGKFRIPKHAGPKTQTGNITTPHHILKPVSVFSFPYLVSPQTLLRMLQNTNQQNPNQRF